MAETPITAAVLVIGDEILSGRTKDRNVGYIAEYLARAGVELREARVVPDVEAEIVDALNALRARYDYVFTTGGIGPTHDDITADAVAKAFGVEIGEDPRALAMMLERYTDADLTPARRRMARIPAGADLVENPVSKAPGFRIGNVIVMAGVPSVMQAMLDDAMKNVRGGAVMLTTTIEAGRTAGGAVRRGLARGRGRAAASVDRLLPLFPRRAVPEPDRRAGAGGGGACRGKKRSRGDDREPFGRREPALSC